MVAPAQYFGLRSGLYEGNVFGGFWPGRKRKGDDHAKDVNVDRLGARGETNAKGIAVIYVAPHPKDGHRRLARRRYGLSQASGAPR